MTKHVPLALALLSVAAAAQAQTRFGIGPQLGYILATTNYKFDNATFDNRYRSGFAGGLTAELGAGHLLVRPALLYAQKGYNQEYTINSAFGYTGGSSSRTRLDYLAIPLNLGYAQHRDGQGFQVFAGAYFGFVLGGHYSSEVAYSSPTASGTIRENYAGSVVRDGAAAKNSDLPVRAHDFGLQGGLGYRYQSLLVQLEYGVGLKDVEPDHASNGGSGGSPTYYNRAFHFSLAYLFGPKS